MTLEGDFAAPTTTSGAIIFAHGSGSSRKSPRNREVANSLHESGFATLLFDLLTLDEEKREARTGYLRFDIDMLAARLMEATDWLLKLPEARVWSIGYFGASTGAAAALVAAVRRPAAVQAVVSRGGRPDLAGPALAMVRAPTLLIVGERDAQVAGFNRAAFERLTCAKDMETVPGATHMFEEPGALDQVSELASDWFTRYVPSSA